MSKKRRSTKEKRLSTAFRNEVRSALRREYPTDPRLIVIGLVLLVIGGILYFLANSFTLAGWVETLVNRAGVVLLGTGVALIIATMIGRIQSS